MTSENSSYTITGNLVDIFQRRTYPAKITIENGKITSIEECSETDNHFIIPPFVDAHIHIESSMITPCAFAKLAVVHGTVATVSDPHEIANVCGEDGVHYMINNSKLCNFKFFFGVPSCVPATGFETAGATIDSKGVDRLLHDPDTWYLSEMMNYPGVLCKDQEVMAKIAAAHKAGKPVDGHAPGLRGQDAVAYASAGITTDHECFTLDEALDKIAAGMHIIIREGSAAKNYTALADLLQTHPDKVMFCSDDKHPDDLVISHINALVKRSLQRGYDLYDILRAASHNPIMHYKLPVGLLRVGDPADLVVVNNLEELHVQATYINGQKVAENGISLIIDIEPVIINNFKCSHINIGDIQVKATSAKPTIRVIEAIEGQLITKELQLPAKVRNGYIVSDPDRDILKMVVVNRYENGIKPAICFIKNFGLRHGALASTVAHDCHNIIAIGADDESICAAINALIDTKGGICVARSREVTDVMPLPIAGLMSAKTGQEAAKEYTLMNKYAHYLGTPLHAPFMTLSFMALLVIPSLKLSDKGLFDGNKFEFVNLEVER